VYCDSPKYAVASVIGFLKGKECDCHSQGGLWQGAQFHRRASLGSGNAVSTVGFELEHVRHTSATRRSGWNRGTFKLGN